ncbi:MAG: hypothetical protein ACLR7U_10395 [Ruthenibacterium lactatiformans]
MADAMLPRVCVLSINRTNRAGAAQSGPCFYLPGRRGIHGKGAERMTLEFTVEQKENGMLLRDFLRKRGVSAALAKGVKASDGFFRRRARTHGYAPFSGPADFLCATSGLLRRCCPSAAAGYPV